MSAIARSRTLRSRSSRAACSLGEPPSPKSRSNTARGLLSIGIGVVGSLHE